MATKKEMVAELIARGADEVEIKDLKNTELEALLETANGDSAPADEQAEVVEPKADELKADEPVVASVEGDVVRETNQQLGIFSDYIYNVKHKDAVLVVENLGYGDIYVSSEGLAKVGQGNQRILFGESVKFEGVERLYFTSASQPVVQILEVK